MVTILSPTWFQFVPAVCTMVNCKARNTVFVAMLLEVADRPLGQLTASVRAGKVTEKSAFTLRQFKRVTKELLQYNRGKPSSSKPP